MKGGRLVAIAEVETETREFVLDSDDLTLGRAETNQVVVPDERVSRTHLRIERDGTGVRITDLCSANGTFVNGEQVTSAVLRDGDMLVVGTTEFRFEAGGPRPTQQLMTIESPLQFATIAMHDPLSVLVNDTTAPCLVVFEAGRTWRVDLGEGVVIGRDKTADVLLASQDVSRAHARVERRGEEFWLRDLDSRNGTFVGSRRVDEQRLEDGETIRIGRARIAFKLGFGTEDLEEGPESVGERRPVVIVPGLMGSELWRGDERIWPNLRAMFLHPEVGALPDVTPIEARGLLQDMVIVPNLIKLDQYNRLSGYLVEELGYRRDVDLLEFGYDWRQDCRRSAAGLGAAIAAWRERERAARRPVTIIAHSLGCLVARYYVERLGGKEVVDRLVLLGGPHAGVPKAVTALARGPDLLPFGLFGGRIRDVLKTYPSMYQILPVYDCATDDAGSSFSVLDDESWLADWQRELVRDARAFRQELGVTTSVPTVCIFGYGLETVMGINIRRATEGWANLKLALATEGDDVIPVASASMDGVDIHPVRQHHGSLYTDNDVKMRLKIELTRPVRPGVVA
jgi:pSer/pThr/pTyr-binding forkhead associated (FHA) protein